MPLPVVVVVAAAGLAIVSLSVCAKGFSRAHLRPNNNARHQAPGTKAAYHQSTIDHRPSIFQSHCQLYFSFGRIGSVLFMIIFYGLLYLITRAGVGRTTITKSASGDNTNVGT